MIRQPINHISILNYELFTTVKYLFPLGSNDGEGLFARIFDPPHPCPLPRGRGSLLSPLLGERVRVAYMDVAGGVPIRGVSRSGSLRVQNLI
jgi:hypothetical protein